MITIKTIDQISEILHNSDLTWLLPNLRQDYAVWNSLNDPAFYEKFTQLKPAGSTFIPEDFSPSKLALLAMDQSDLINADPISLLDSLDNQVLQMAIRSFNDQTLLQANPQDLVSAGLIALALAYKFRATHSWNGLLDTIQEKPGLYWFSPMACLYGYLGDPSELLHSLVQPGTASVRYELAVHIVLSNPISPNEQIAILMGLCHGTFGDPLPASDRLLLINSLFEQRPQAAVDFCSKWLEIHPESSAHPYENHNDTLENINRLAENLFQIEVRIIAGKSHNLSDLLFKESELSQNLHLDLINHSLTQTSRAQLEKPSAHELSDLRKKAIQLSNLNTSPDKYSSPQAELALILSDQGLIDEAIKLLPDPEAPLPDDPDILYAIAKLSLRTENNPRADHATARITDLLNNKPTSYNIPIWGDNFSQINFGKLLLDLHKPEDAVQVFELAERVCPNDSSLLELLADSYKSSHKDHEASKTYRVLVSLNPGNLDYHRSFAQSLEAIGDWEAGLLERSIIVESTKGNGKSLLTKDMYAYAHSALKSNHPDQALSICNDILSINQEDSQAFVFTGKAYLMMNETDKGMEFLIRATQVSPHLSEAWLALTDAQKKIYPLKAIIETLKNASQAVPDSAQIHFTLGDAYLQDNAPTLALPELQMAVELSADTPQFLVSYGQVLKSLGNSEESRNVFSKAYNLEPNYSGLAQMYAKTLIDMGKLEEALSPLETLINSKSLTDPIPYLDFARCVLTLHKLGSTKVSPMKALIALNEALQIDPELAEAKALTAEALSASGEKELAFQAYREALDTSLIEDKNWLERLSFGFGCIASSIGKHDIAIAALQEAGQVNPRNPEVFMALSDAYSAAKLPEDAVRSARNVLVIDGDNPDNLAWFAKQAAKLMREEKPDISNSPASISKQIPSEALNALTKAIQLAPTRTDLLVQLGDFQSSIGALSEAQATFASIGSLDFAAIEDLKSASEYLSKIGDHTAAIACLENGISQDQNATEKHDPVLYTRLAQEYVQNHDHTSAINILDKAIELIPEDSSLISLKIDILLGFGQSIEALACIEATVQNCSGGQLVGDLHFLASRINRSIGDFSNAIRHAKQGVAASLKESAGNNQSILTIQHLTQIAEIYRALIQPDQAYQIIQTGINNNSPVLMDEPGYLDFICLHTELALETGEQIRSDIQDVKIEPSNPYYSRVMAIAARLMNKAGNYMQAEQMFQIALKNMVNPDQSPDLPNWSASYIKYINMISIIEAALDLGLWDQATSWAQQVLESSPAEPLSDLNLARAVILSAEFNNLCEIVEVSKHKPLKDSLSKEVFDQLTQYLEKAKSLLEPYKDEIIVNNHDMTNGQVSRWLSRGEIAFNHYDDSNPDPSEVLTHLLSPGDTAALINHLHHQDLRDPDRDSVNRIIKIARSYPRNPAVILQVALALHDDNPADAMKSLQSIVEQNPFSKNSTIAFCNILLAKIALNLDEYDTAQLATDSAIEFWPDEPYWHILAAQIYKRTSDTTSAINHLSEAAHLGPKNIAFHMELGKVYFENANEDPHMLKEAGKSFENVLALDPNDVSALIYLSNTQSILNELEKAEANARNALVLAPDRADIYQLLSELSIKNNDFQGAYEYANKAIQISPKDVQSTIMLAHSLSALGRHHEALAKLNAVIPTAPEAKSLHLERVNILRKVDGPRAGLNELKILANSYPDDFKILNALAKSYIEVGELEDGVNIAQQALKICTDRTSHNEQANLHLLIGQVLRKSGQLDQSIFHLNEAIQLSPDRLEPYLELGLARKERREYQQALQIFERATVIAPDDPRAPFQAGLALKESKDYKSSEMMLRRAVSLAPNDLNIRRQLAAVVALNLVHNPRGGRN